MKRQKNGMKRLVLTALDSPRRDFEWRLFLASKLAEAGVSTAIGKKHAIREIQSRSRNAILLGRLGSAGNRSEADIAWTKTFDSSGTRWLYFHDEGGLYAKGHYATGAARAYPEPFFDEKYLKRVFFWGPRQAALFSPHRSENKFQVTGAPRFDLMRQKYDYLDQLEKERLISRFGGYTLICTRFASANRVEDDAHPLSARIRQIAIESGVVEDIADHSLIRRQFEGWRKVAHEFADFLPAVVELALSHPNRMFVIRPHPAEKSSIYQTAFSAFKNVQVEKAGDVRSLIRGADCVIHSECTTGLEAAINQKPVINFRPWRGSGEFDVAGVSEVGACCSDIDSLLFCYQKVVSGDAVAATGVPEGIHDIVANASDKTPEATQLMLDSILAVSDEMRGSTEVGALGIMPMARKYAGGVRRNIRSGIKHLKNREFPTAVGHADSKRYDYTSEKIRELWADFGESGKLVIKNGVVWVIAE